MTDDHDERGGAGQISRTTASSRSFSTIRARAAF
jgi:hypothetical protein